ncbi:hypothetical protein PR048_013671 [Dryococelus australis]|uniref:Uncharacterized protein n=1 Tax=Dryococelus australis TaxID=614101 RepID=A0ABQ9HSZ6_9NEOP|nr:hypothetical protein PR048_013671 [Dryococelus australis]
MYKFLLIENLKADALIGYDFIRKHMLIQDLYAKAITLILTQDKIIAHFLFENYTADAKLESEYNKLPFQDIDPALYPENKTLKTC